MNFLSEENINHAAKSQTVASKGDFRKEESAYKKIYRIWWKIIWAVFATLGPCYGYICCGKELDCAGVTVWKDAWSTLFTIYWIGFPKWRKLIISCPPETFRAIKQLIHTCRFLRFEFPVTPAEAFSKLTQFWLESIDENCFPQPLSWKFIFISLNHFYLVLRHRYFVELPSQDSALVTPWNIY